MKKLLFNFLVYIGVVKKEVRSYKEAILKVFSVKQIQQIYKEYDSGSRSCLLCIGSSTFGGLWTIDKAEISELAYLYLTNRKITTFETNIHGGALLFYAKDQRSFEDETNIRVRFLEWMLQQVKD